MVFVVLIGEHQVCAEYFSCRLFETGTSPNKGYQEGDYPFLLVCCLLLVFVLVFVVADCFWVVF